MFEWERTGANGKKPTPLSANFLIKINQTKYSFYQTSNKFPCSVFYLLPCSAWWQHCKNCKFSPFTLTFYPPPYYPHTFPFPLLILTFYIRPYHLCSLPFHHSSSFFLFSYSHIKHSHFWQFKHLKGNLAPPRE